MAGIQIPIEVVDKFSKQLDSLNKGMDKLTDGAKKQNQTFNLLAADVIIRYGREAIGAIARFGEDCLKSFGESERAIAKLDNAIKNQGITARGYSERLQEQASALQLVSTQSDEAIMGTESLLTTFGLAGKELDKSTRASLNLAAGLGIDLHAATLLIGKAWTGETGALSRFGLKIDDTASSSEKFAQVLNQVNSRFGGAAAAEAQTYSGKIEVLKNRFDDLKEKIGKELLPVAEKWMEWVGKAIGVIDKQVDGNGSLAKSHGPVLDAMRQQLVLAKQEAENAPPALAEEKNRQLREMARNYTALVKAKKDSGDFDRAVSSDPKSKGGAQETAADKKAHSDAMRAADEKSQALAMRAAEEIGMATNSAAELEMIKSQHLETELQMDLQFDTAEDVRRAAQLKADKVFRQGMLANASTALNALGTLQTAKSKELQVVGKAAAISGSIVDTWRAATGMLAAPPIGPWNYALAAAVVAAGMANVARISGVPLAEGGMVRSRPGGMQATIGEGGRDEAVIPLDDPRTQQRLAGALGGGKAININVGGISVSINGDSLGGNPRGIAAKLAEEIRTETVDSIMLALRLSNIATLNAGLAA